MVKDHGTPALAQDMASESVATGAGELVKEMKVLVTGDQEVTGPEEAADTTVEEWELASLTKVATVTRVSPMAGSSVAVIRRNSMPGYQGVTLVARTQVDLGSVPTVPVIKWLVYKRWTNLKCNQNHEECLLNKACLLI